MGHASAGEPAEWQQAASFGDTLLYLTPAELARLRDSLQDLAEPYLERVTAPAKRPRGSRPIVFMQLAIPRLDEAS